jgi:hypothetical protein
MLCPLVFEITNDHKLDSLRNREFENQLGFAVVTSLFHVTKLSCKVSLLHQPRDPALIAENAECVLVTLMLRSLPPSIFQYRDLRALTNIHTLRNRTFCSLVVGPAI